MVDSQVTVSRKAAICWGGKVLSASRSFLIALQSHIIDGKMENIFSMWKVRELADKV